MKSFKKTDAYKKVRLIGKSFRTSRLANKLPTRRLRKFLVKEIRKILFKRRFHKGVPIFILQMGKVGSRSVTESLQNYHSGAVIHAHIMDDKDWGTQYIIDWVNNGNPIKIISPVRDPIGRNVSVFFHFVEGRLGHTKDKSKLSVSELVDLFINNSDPDEVEVNKAMMDHDMPLEWFDKYIKKYFHIDVFASPYLGSDYKIFLNDNVDLLVYRIDLDDKKKEEVIRDFLSIPEFSLENTNIGSSKGYSGKYKEFKECAVLPESYLDKMCESKYFRHFYSDDEIQSIRKKWLRD